MAAEINNSLVGYSSSSDSDGSDCDVPTSLLQVVGPRSCNTKRTNVHVIASPNQKRSKLETSAVWAIIAWITINTHIYIYVYIGMGLAVPFYSVYSMHAKQTLCCSFYKSNAQISCIFHGSVNQISQCQRIFCSKCPFSGIPFPRIAFPRYPFL